MPPLEPEAEAELARRCAAGERAAWERFVDAYGGLLQGLVRRMLSRRTGRAQDPDVEEVSAEVFLALLRRDRLLLRRYDPTWRLSTYLGVIARTEVVRHLRRRGRGGPSAPVDAAAQVPAPAVDPAQALLDEERAAAIASLRAALDELAERDRLLLTLRYLDGRDYRAIARAVGTSPESVGQLLTRAKARLAKRLPHLAERLREP
jgi:RNA polymerase sigma factor (sigma-70 family)